MVLQDILRDTEDHDLAPAISHFLNCLFGNCQAVTGKGVANTSQSKTLKKVNKFSFFTHIYSQLARVFSLGFLGWQSSCCFGAWIQ